MLEKQSQQLLQRQLQLQQNLSQNTASEHNISAKLPIHPSYVPSIGCLSSLNNQHMHGSQSKLSLNHTSSNLNLNQSSRENLGISHGPGTLNLNLSGITTNSGSGFQTTTQHKSNWMQT